MNRASIFPIAIAVSFAHSVHASVLYECNTQRDYISVEEENHKKTISSVGNKETISASAMTEITGNEKKAQRRGAKPIIKRCHLSSGEYVLKFDAHWINADLYGLDGQDDWVTVEISNEKGAVLSRTVMGRCESARPATANCKDAWAVNIWLAGRAGKPMLTRIIDEYPP